MVDNIDRPLTLAEAGKPRKPHKPGRARIVAGANCREGKA
jgi:hypothetical protein